MLLFLMIASIEAKSLRKIVRVKECSMIAFLSLGRIKSTSLVQFKSCVLSRTEMRFCKILTLQILQICSCGIVDWNAAAASSSEIFLCLY